MNPLPCRKLELYSPMPPATLLQVLRDSVEPKRWLRRGAGTRPFEGVVTPPTFHIQRIISHRNAFLPQIRGTITPDGNGSRILLTMRPALAAAIFMTIWLSGVLLAAIVSATIELGLALLPMGMFLFGSTLTVKAFSVEARRAKELLVFLLDGIQRPDAMAHR
jgi:hypothetical protein